MKITHIDIVRFSIKMKPFVIATGTMQYAQNMLIKIFTDEGLYGIGECSAFPMIVGETQDSCILMAKAFASLWKGKNPLDIETRLQELTNFVAFNTTAKSAFDMALYDLAAKAKNKPLYQFLGGTKRAIETDITIGIGSPDDMAALAQTHQQNGARILKIKLGKDVNEDIERIYKIRETVGKNMILRIDANQGWSFEDAGNALYAMESLTIQFCEQPMRSYFDDYLPELRMKSPIKIMADESCYNHHDARKLIAANACDFINIKLAKSGGINEALKIYDVAQQSVVDCMIGGMLESRVALSANLHLAYACPNINYFDLDTCLLGHLEDPVIGGVTFDGFMLNILDSPGIGADVDPVFLNKCEKITI